MVRARKARGDEMHWGTGAREAVEEAANKLAAHVGHAGGGPTLPTLAIVGRRNVGKSTLLNALVGKMRAVSLLPSISAGAWLEGTHSTLRARFLCLRR
jgi:putative ribosome biogenesis GTPase RsgA